MIQVIVEIKEIRIKRKRGEEYETYGKEKQKKEKAMIDEIFIWKEKIENIYGYIDDQNFIKTTKIA